MNRRVPLLVVVLFVLGTMSGAVVGAQGSNPASAPVIGSEQVKGD